MFEWSLLVVLTSNGLSRKSVYICLLLNCSPIEKFMIRKSSGTSNFGLKDNELTFKLIATIINDSWWQIYHFNMQAFILT